MPSPITAGYAKGAKAYVAGRPDYPVAVLGELPLAETIIELGAGTGKFTALLARTGKRIIAVEPIREMASHIRLDDRARIEVRHGTAEAIPAPDRAAGLVCCATCFHWFDYGPATREIVRVLEPGGALALIWNERDDRVPWVAAFSKMLDDYAGDSPRRTSETWRAIFDDPRFEHRTTWSASFTQALSPDGLFDRALSTSFIALLPPTEQDIVRARVMAIVDGQGPRAAGDMIEFPYITRLLVFRLLG